MKAAASGSSKFFFGSDSAPHPLSAKRGGDDGQRKIAAGVFTQPYVTQLVVDALSRAISQNILNKEDVTNKVIEGFLGSHGRKFYGIEPSRESISLSAGSEKVVTSLTYGGEYSIIPFRRKEKTLGLSWITSL